MVIFNCAESPRIRIGTHCINYRIAVLSYGGQDVLTNLVLLCWPLHFLWGLKLDRPRKAHLVGVFALGGLYVNTVSSFICVSEAALTMTYTAHAPPALSDLSI